MSVCMRDPADLCFRDADLSFAKSQRFDGKSANNGSFITLFSRRRNEVFHDKNVFGVFLTD